jgi:hypothetical protein
MGEATDGMAGANLASASLRLSAQKGQQGLLSQLACITTNCAAATLLTDRMYRGKILQTDTSCVTAEAQTQFRKQTRATQLYLNTHKQRWAATPLLLTKKQGWAEFHTTNATTYAE